MLGVDGVATVGTFCGDVLRPRAFADGRRPCETACPIVASRESGQAQATEVLSRADGSQRTIIITSAGMGEPVKILDLAQDLLKLYGYEAGKDIDIAITGIRPGEKLYEELFTAREQMAATQNERIFIGNFDKEVSTGIIEKIEGFFQSNEHVTDADTVVLLKEVLPEYHYSN